jgi:hypothetical protein
MNHLDTQLLDPQCKPTGGGVMDGGCNDGCSEDGFNMRIYRVTRLGLNTTVSAKRNIHVLFRTCPLLHSSIRHIQARP